MIELDSRTVLCSHAVTRQDMKAPTGNDHEEDAYSDPSTDDQSEAHQGRSPPADMLCNRWFAQRSLPSFNCLRTHTASILQATAYQVSCLCSAPCLLSVGLHMKYNRTISRACVPVRSSLQALVFACTPASTHIQKQHAHANASLMLLQALMRPHSPSSPKTHYSSCAPSWRS